VGWGLPIYPDGLNDESRSGFDFSMVALLKHRGFSREETEAVLRMFTFGQYADSGKEGQSDRAGPPMPAEMIG
jgi:hypothetical protein